MITSLLISSQASAWKLYDTEHDDLYLSGGAYTHYSDSENYRGAPVLVSLEVYKPNDHFYGLALFNNSYSQFSQYVYYGKMFRFDNVYPGLHAKVSAGFIHGYKDEYEDNLFLNKQLGVAPAIVPGIGYHQNRWTFDLFALANKGVLLGIGYKL